MKIYDVTIIENNEKSWQNIVRVIVENNGSSTNGRRRSPGPYGCWNYGTIALMVRAFGC